MDQPASDNKQYKKRRNQGMWRGFNFYQSSFLKTDIFLLFMILNFKMKKIN
jgi:hypothetical protein